VIGQGEILKQVDDLKAKTFMNLMRNQLTGKKRLYHQCCGLVCPFKLF
jgi:hypothetical protein